MNNRNTQDPTAAQAAGASGELMFSLLHTAGELQERMDRAFESAGLSSAKYGVLAELAQAGESLPLSELAARLHCVRSNMTQLVDRLEADGLVRRVDDPSDRRIIRAELTEPGRERAEAGARQLAAVQAAFASSLTEAERQALQGILAALR